MGRYIYLLCGKEKTFFFSNMQITTITHPKMILLKRDFGFTGFGESIFQNKTVGIQVGTNCARLLSVFCTHKSHLNKNFNFTFSILIIFCQLTIIVLKPTYIF